MAPRADSEDGDLCFPPSLGSALATLALWWNPVSGHLLTSCCLFRAQELRAGGRQACPSCVRAPAHLPHPWGASAWFWGPQPTVVQGVDRVRGAVGPRGHRAHMCKSILTAAVTEKGLGIGKRFRYRMSESGERRGRGRWVVCGGLVARGGLVVCGGLAWLGTPDEDRQEADGGHDRGTGTGPCQGQEEGAWVGWGRWWTLNPLDS